MLTRRSPYRRPALAAALTCWALALLVALTPALASAGGRGRARRSKVNKTRTNKLRTLRTRTQTRTRKSKRARTRARLRGSKLSRRMRVRSQARKQRKSRLENKLEANNSKAAKAAKAASKARVGRTARRLASKDRQARTRSRKKKTRRPRARKQKKSRKKKGRPTRKARKRYRAASKKKARSGFTESTLTNTGTLGLLATGARSIHRAANLNRSLHQVLGVVAPVALAIGSTYGMVRARGAEERLEAGHGLLWASQGGADFAGKSLANFGMGLGLAGGSLQVGVGAYRVWTGIKSRNWSRVVTGLLDTTAGTAWAMTAVSYAMPTTMGVFIGATAVKMIFENRKAIASGARKIGERLGRWGRRLRNFGLPKRWRSKPKPEPTAEPVTASL